MVFYKRTLIEQEQKTILDILSEGVITVEFGGLTYFNRQAKKILYQCIEDKDEKVKNGAMIEIIAGCLSNNKPITKSDI